MRPLQAVCGHECAMLYGKVLAAKKSRSDVRVRKEKLKSRSDYMKEAQNIFNKFIRARDEKDPCISCGRYVVEHTLGGAWDCGHYLSRGARPELRFEELNAHKQCKSCNGGAGKYARKNYTVTKEYKERLIFKIGAEKVEWLEGPHEAKHYTIDDLKQIKETYKAKLKELNRGEG